MRIFTAALATETNTFAPMPCAIASFKDRSYFPSGTHPDHMTFLAGPVWATRLRGKERGWDVVEGLVAAAQPNGLVTRVAYETLRTELLDDLKRALPVDIVALGLHGAMMADGYDDCEGDLLTHVRALVGPDVVVGAGLDLHSHLSPTMVEQADVLISYKEYPHTDMLERANELLDLCEAKHLGKIALTAAVHDCQMLVTMHTPKEPVRSFVDRISAMEGHDGILSISIIHGFPWADTADIGAKVLVYTDGDAAQAQKLADTLGQEIRDMRDALTIHYPDIDTALDQALAHEGSPCIISDGADNPGGGAAADSTFFLRRLLARDIQNVALGPLWDPIAVGIAFDAGIGARLPMRIGGKISPMSGDPVDAVCTIKALHRNMTMTGLSNAVIPMGDCALIETQGIEIVLISSRMQAVGTDLFTNLGCDLTRKRIIVVKSSQHFYASYTKVAGHVIYAEAPGSVTLDKTQLPYTKIPRPIWPLDL